MGGIKTIEMERVKGDTFPISGRIAINKRPVNMDGKTAKLYIYASPNVVIDATVDGDPSSGRVSFDMTEAASLSVGNYFCEIKLHDTHVRTFLRIDLSIV
ncbi:BppU family phage baseplate upper protein [Hydrogenimonas sp.]